MALEDILAAPTVRPVNVGFLDFKDDPVRGWDAPGIFAPTGTGDADLDGETFGEAQGAVDISEIVENGGIGAPVTITFAAGNMDDEDIVVQLVADRRAFQGRKAVLWRVFMLDDGSGVHPEVDRLFTGVMVGASTNRQPGTPATVTVVCDQDTQKAKVAPLRYADHPYFYPGDTAMTFLTNMSRAPISGAERHEAPVSNRFSPPATTGGRWRPNKPTNRPGR